MCAVTDLDSHLAASLSASLSTPEGGEVAVRLHELAVQCQLTVPAGCLRGLLHLRLHRQQFFHVRQLYNQGRARGIYPNQQARD